jgi:predicted deacetylase
VFRRALGFDPPGFIPPKWMAGPHLLPQLAEQGYDWTEDDRAVYALPQKERFAAPVITWATRAWWRRQTSLWGVPVLARWWRQAPVLRVAMHPFDFDHADIVASIAHVVRQAVATRRQAFYPELLASARHGAAA